MASVAVTVDDAMAKELQARLNRISNWSGHFRDLYRKMTALGETQTRRRISKERSGPEGETWPEWSPRYAKTRHSRQSLLISKGHLVDSISDFVDNEQAGWGSPLIYAAAQQFGRPEIQLPARPYLGISEANLAEFAEVLEAWAWSQLNG